MPFDILASRETELKEWQAHPFPLGHFLMPMSDAAVSSAHVVHFAASKVRTTAVGARLMCQWCCQHRRAMLWIWRGQHKWGMLFSKLSTGSCRHVLPPGTGTDPPKRLLLPLFTVNKRGWVIDSPVQYRSALKLSLCSAPCQKFKPAPALLRGCHQASFSSSFSWECVISEIIAIPYSFDLCMVV